jgi:hypothetical protein
MDTPCIEARHRWKNGYGRHRRRYLHRHIIELVGEDHTGRKWDPALHVMHLCDNPPCFRFDHLLLGTHADNMADAGRKGRMWKAPMPGEQHPAHLLTEADVMEVRRRYDLRTESVRAIARDYPQVRYDAIYDAVTRRSWKHLDDGNLNPVVQVVVGFNTKPQDPPLVAADGEAVEAAQEVPPTTEPPAASKRQPKQETT